MFLIRWIILLAILTLTVVKGFDGIPALSDLRQEKLALALLVPDEANLDDPKLTAWLDAASEQGVKLDVLTASQFLRPYPFSLSRYAGVILPDSIHKMMSETLIGGVHDYVSSGGKLMLVFDAGTLLPPNQTYAQGQSLFSDLVGVNYAMYDTLGDKTIAMSEVFGEQVAFISLHVPPGKFSASQSGNPQLMSLSGYQNDSVEYSYFVTDTQFSGKTLLSGKGNKVIASVNTFGTGQVLFINLPLGYLKNRTDGVLLNGFMHYFSENIVKLPTLSSVPDGLGGLIVNLHIDSNANLPGLIALKKKSKFFNYGPYSVHITSGPDVNVEGDGLGFNLSKNKEAAEWVRFFQKRGDQIGSHGGWIHNYFGEFVTDANQDLFTPLLEKNKQALEAILNHPVNEYSAPMGNHPDWVTKWLDNQNIGSYYFTGDIGSGPTKSYRDEARPAGKAWAFPVLTMGKHASFEEMHESRVEEKIIDQWLNAVSTFTADNRVARLIYFHPPGILNYPSAIDNWLTNSDQLNKSGRFNWYTMSDIAKFLDEREKTAWSINRVDNHQVVLSAENINSLAHMTWLLPKSAYENPEILSGNVNISQDDKYLIIRAIDGKSLKVNLRSSL
jgi:hypothetical protein